MSNKMLLQIITHHRQNPLDFNSLCSFLKLSVTSFLLGPNILLSTLFSNTLNLCSSLNVRVKFNTHTKQRVK
jgi:hypothetical protein